MASTARSESEPQDLCHVTDTPLHLRRNEQPPEHLQEDRLPSTCTQCAHLCNPGGCGDGYRDSGTLPLTPEIGTQHGYNGDEVRVRGLEHRSLQNEEVELDETEATGKSLRTDECRNFINALPGEFKLKGRREDDEEPATSELEEKDGRAKPTTREDDTTSLRLQSESRQRRNSRHVDGASRPFDGPKLAWGSPGTERKVRITIIRSKKTHGDSAKDVSSTGSDLSYSPTSVKGERRSSDAAKKEETRLPHIPADGKRNSRTPDTEKMHQSRRSGEDGKTPTSQTIERELKGGNGAGKQSQAECKGQVASSIETSMSDTEAGLQGSGDQPGRPPAESHQGTQNGDFINAISKTYRQRAISSTAENVKLKPKGIFSKWVGHTKRALKFKSTKQNGTVIKVSQDARPSSMENGEAEPVEKESTKPCPSPQPVSKRPERNLTEMFAARSNKQTLTTTQEPEGSSA